MRRFFTLIWASPNTLLGLLVALCTLFSGGHVQCHSGVLEVYGGFARWLLKRGLRGALAMTLGHVVLATTREALDFSREHERIHVRQYERWGPLFLPAYGFCSFAAWWTGKRAYRDNHFEREAYGDENE